MIRTYSSFSKTALGHCKQEPIKFTSVFTAFAAPVYYRDCTVFCGTVFTERVARNYKSLIYLRFRVAIVSNRCTKIYKKKDTCSFLKQSDVRRCYLIQTQTVCRNEYPTVTELNSST